MIHVRTANTQVANGPGLAQPTAALHETVETKLPFARIIGFRFKGYDLRHMGHPQLVLVGALDYKKLDTREDMARFRVF